MKLILFIAAALFSSTTMASKARVSALQGANHLIDTQTVFISPSHVLLLDPYLTFEMGAPGAAAEGGLLKSLDNGGKLMVYLGHQNTTASDAAADMRANSGYLTQNNPLEVIYGKGDMAFGASLSNVSNDQTGTKETTLVGKWGMNYSDQGWSYAHLTLISTAENEVAGGTDKAKVMPYLTVGGSHIYKNNSRFYGELNYGSGEETPAGGGAKTTADDMNVMLGFQNVFVKSDEADIYYGIEYRMAKRTVEIGNTDFDAESIRLPAYFGIEYQAKEWAIIRASVRQNILIGSTKDEISAMATTKKDGIAADTQVSAGLGLRFKNILLDGSLTAANNGQINGNQFLSQASLTYNF